MKTAAVHGRCLNINEENAVSKFAENLRCCISEEEGKTDSLSFICIGSDRATGDSLGPVVGHMLSRKIQNCNVKIYGSLSKPVHAINITDTLGRIYSENKNTLIIAVDAALSKYPDRVGVVSIGAGAVRPGAFAGKALPPVGHIYITGVVNWASRLNDIEILQSTRLGLVMKMAEIITGGIYLTVCKRSRISEFQHRDLQRNQTVLQSDKRVFE